MDYDYYYADLGIGLHIRADKVNALSDLTDRERLSLQQVLYMSLSGFVYVRSLYAADIAALQIRIKSEKEQG